MAATENMRYLKITFTDGTERMFAYAPLEEDAVFASRVLEIMESNNLVLTFDEHVEIFPMANVRSIQIAPRPGKELPHSITILHEFND